MVPQNTDWISFEVGFHCKPDHHYRVNVYSLMAATDDEKFLILGGKLKGKSWSTPVFVFDTKKKTKCIRFESED